jgi:hypothetical protein
MANKPHYRACARDRAMHVWRKFYHRKHPSVVRCSVCGLQRVLPARPFVKPKGARRRLRRGVEIIILPNTVITVTKPPRPVAMAQEKAS